MEEKEYGKLTAEQFKRLIGKLPDFQRAVDDFGQSLNEANPEKLHEIFGEGVSWSHLYERPLAEVAGLMVYAIGQLESLKTIVQLPDPQEFILTEWEKLEGTADWKDVPKGLTKKDVIAIATALQKNVMSIIIYKKSLCALVAEAREGNMDSLFDAVRIDRSVVSCPSVAARISMAELVGNKRFFLRLRNALKGPSKKYWQGREKLRYGLATLRDMGVQDLGDVQLEELFVKILDAYPKSYTARKNLRKQYTESKKINRL
jgi:hypothetical protein